VWDFLGLPPPTPVQNDIAYYLQHGPRRAVVEAFRGVGKSWITVAFVLWLLFLDPQKKIMVVSASQPLADDFSKFCKQLIDGMPLLQHLAPKQGQLDSSIRFDVGPATPSKDPSVKSAGITGQITGSRADVIVADDIEIPKNSYTHLLRERLSELVKEFDAVLKPGGRIIYLGTPQVEATLYNRLLTRGYEIRIWPAEVPAKLEAYHGRLSGFVQRLIEQGIPFSTPIDAKRFSREDLNERRASYGLSGYALQFMLDTNPAESDKHPLKTHDLIIHDCDLEMGHVKLIWSGDRVALVTDLQSGGFDGDYYVLASWKSAEMAKYTGTVMAIDPSGRGQDETAYAIVRNLHGMLYLVDVGGFRDGFSEATLNALATRAIRFRVNYVIDETNYGGGMFRQLLKPVMQRIAEEARLDPKNPDPNARPPSFDEEYDGWSSTQKELRILDTLEPIVQSHRLVVDRKVIETDLVIQNDNLQYSFIQQFTRMSRIRGCLAHEDRLEAVSMACNYWMERMKIDKDRALKNYKEELLVRDLQKFLDHTVNAGSRRGSRSANYLRWRK
jgi:hypothetical protein